MQFYHGSSHSDLTGLALSPVDITPGTDHVREGRTSGSSRGVMTIIYDFEHAYRANPADAAQARGMTAHFTADISVSPRIPKQAGFHGRYLWLKIWMTPRTRGLRSSSVFSLLARKLEFTGSTLS